MKTKEYFNQFYKENTKNSYSLSLNHFFEGLVRPRLENKILKILDLGSGPYSLFEDINNLNANIAAIDYSTYAISNAPKTKISYKEINVLDREFFSENKFDLIFDSHCLHCISFEGDLRIALENIYQSLDDGGLFASELMIQPEISDVVIPFKTINSAYEIEQIILSLGFKILVFKISHENFFSNIVDGEEVKCDLLNLIAQK